jgi:uncharacterized protein YecE (DUF72 family)
VTVFVGTSGWQYRHWRGVFYPKGLRQADELDFYTRHFQTVEVNSTFYRLPPRSVFEGWARRTPPDFVLTLKVSRYLTHIRRLRDPREPVQRFCTRASALGGKIGPVLIQLPPNLPRETARLRATLEEFPAGTRLAVEPRHPSWFVDETRELLAEHGAALCWADRDERLLTPLWRTTDWTFVRFHAGSGPPPPCYPPGVLAARARLLDEQPDADAYAYFNNDPAGCAPRDAYRFARMCAELGLPITRVPESEPSTSG